MTLLELLQLLREHLKLVVLLPIICALVTAAYSWGFMPNQYTAETSIYALTRNEVTAQGTASGDGVTYNDLSASQMLANDFAELAKNDDIKARTANALGLEDLDDFDIEVGSSTTTRIIKVDVTGTDGQMAAQVANELASQIGKTAVRVMNVKAVNVVNRASAPAQPSGPSRVLYTLVALLAGLFIAIAIVVVRDMLNTKVKSDTEAEELLGLPIIGRYPYEKEAH